MGNCSLKGAAAAADPKPSNTIRIMTDSGGIVELQAPKPVGEVLREFPGHGVFGQGQLSSPLSHHELLWGNRFYYLLPLGKERLPVCAKATGDLSDECANMTEPIRMSSSAALDLVTDIANGPALEVLPPPRKGVWRVKLLIDTKQLEEILSEADNTEALIEKMRMAASSATGTPKAAKRRGSLGVSWKFLTNVFKDSQNRVRSLDLCSSSNPS